MKLMASNNKDNYENFASNMTDIANRVLTDCKVKDEELYYLARGAKNLMKKIALIEETEKQANKNSSLESTTDKALERLKNMNPKELLGTFVDAGIVDANGKLMPAYQQSCTCTRRLGDYCPTTDDACPTHGTKNKK